MNPLLLWVVDAQTGAYGAPEQLWECAGCGTIVRYRNRFTHPGFCPANPARQLG